MPGPAGASEWLWPDLVPIIWLVFVLATYALLANSPLVPGRGEVPGIAAADRSVLPLLALTGGAAIIRYFVFRPPPKDPPTKPEPQRNRTADEL